MSIKLFFEKIGRPLDIRCFLSNILILVPRIVGGLALTLNFGSSKFGMPWTAEDRNLSIFQVSDWFIDDVAQFGLPFSLAPAFFAWMGAASEAVGGLFLVLGLQTRIAGFFLGCTMLVAIFFQKWNNGLWEMLPAMGFLWISLYSVILGSGRFGLDYFIHKEA